MLFNYANGNVNSITWSSSIRIASTSKIAYGKIGEFFCGVGFVSFFSMSLGLFIGGLGFGSDLVIL